MLFKSHLVVPGTVVVYIKAHKWLGIQQIKILLLKTYTYAWYDLKGFMEINGSKFRKCHNPFQLHCIFYYLLCRPNANKHSFVRAHPHYNKEKQN